MNCSSRNKVQWLFKKDGLCLVFKIKIYKIEVFQDNNKQYHLQSYHNHYTTLHYIKRMDKENPNPNSTPSNPSTTTTQPTQHPNQPTIQNIPQGIMTMDEEGEDSDGEWESDGDQEEDEQDYDEDIDDEDNQAQDAMKQVIEIKPFNISALSPDTTKILSNITTLPTFSQYLPTPPSKKIPKQVCAKIIRRGDTIIQCYDCRIDESCIICMDCFKGGNHEGHRFIAKMGGGGCCDCGDVEAWSQKGFCGRHSGNFKEFEVDEKVLGKFSRTVAQLLYIYFQLSIRKDPKTDPYTAKLLEYLKDLNKDNTYMNKLTSLSLTRPLPPELALNPQLDKHTILELILTSKISGKYFSRWFDLFMMMFSYYPFKMAILKHYMQNYGEIVDGARASINNAISISCQIITSYKLIEQYAGSENIGIGQKSAKPKDIAGLKNYYAMFSHDIDSLTELSGNAPYLYWKMHIKNQVGLKNLFHYYKIIMKKVLTFQDKKSQAQICSMYLDFAEIQLNLVQTFIGIIKAVVHDSDVMATLITTLWNQCGKNLNQNPELLCILRPIQRCLGLALFAFFGCQLDNIAGLREKLINQVLKTSEQKFETGCLMILTRMWKTLSLSARTQAESGLGQTLYPYIYIYKIHSRILSMTDILSVKIFLILMNRDHPLTFESIIDLDRKKLDYQPYHRQKSNFFLSTLRTIRQVYTHVTPEIHITHAMNPESTLYQPQIIQLIINYFYEHQKEKEKNEGLYRLLQQDMSQLLQGILPKQCKIAEKWIKENCTLDKGKKCYTLDLGVVEREMKEAKPTGLNFDDFWTNASSKDPFVDAKKSMASITGPNLQIFKLVWNQISLTSLKNTFDALSSKKDAEVMNILPLICGLFLTSKTNNIDSAESLKQIVMNYREKIPANFLGMQQMETDIKSKESIEMQKKSKLDAIKQKKLQKMKQKQTAFLETHMQQQKLEINKIKSKQQAMQQQRSCHICRNPINEHSVYIVNMDVRNHERLLKLGPGAECVNFSSCRHLFDYKCIEKKFKKNSMTSSITCPLCKETGNLLLPASEKPEKKLEEEVASRVIEILKEIKTEPEFYEELIKCFYHFVLLCAINPRKTIQKRLQIYRTIFTIVKKNIPSKQIKSLRQKITSHGISRYFQKELVQKKQQSQKQSLSFFLRMIGNTEQAAQLELLLANDLAKKQPIKDTNVQRNKKAEYQDIKQEKEDKEKRKLEMFQLTMMEILTILENKQMMSQDTQKKQENENASIEVAFIQQCIKTLNSQTHHPNQQFLQQNTFIKKSCLSILEPLPPTYAQLLPKKCTHCSEISSNLILCLLCNWVGCQNPKCPLGFAKPHTNSTHGQIGAIMAINKAAAYYVRNQKTIYAGNLYEDQWGNCVEGSTNWGEFQVNRGLYEEIEAKLVGDQVPTRNKKRDKEM